MGNGLSPIGPIGNKILQAADTESGSGFSCDPILEERIKEALKFPDSTFAYRLAQEYGITKSPRMSEILDLALKIGGGSALAAGIVRNTALFNSKLYGAKARQIYRNYYHEEYDRPVSIITFEGHH